MAENQAGPVTTRPPGLVDVLDRVLDKGLVVVGDIKISLVNVELLTLQIRLLVCSIDKAEQMGINWWRFDPRLVGPPQDGDREAPDRIPSQDQMKSNCPPEHP